LRPSLRIRSFNSRIALPPSEFGVSITREKQNTQEFAGWSFTKICAGICYVIEFSMKVALA
jgi:hypothetical protein